MATFDVPGTVSNGPSGWPNGRRALHLSHLVKDLKEVHSLWKDTVFGADFGVMVKDGVGPGQDVEIQWVDDTVAVAAAEAERSGWAAVPWEELLQQMLAVAPAQE